MSQFDAHASIADAQLEGAICFVCAADLPEPPPGRPRVCGDCIAESRAEFDFEEQKLTLAQCGRGEE